MNFITTLLITKIKVINNKIIYKFKNIILILLINLILNILRKGN